jgi:hypothetical protein
MALTNTDTDNFSILMTKLDEFIRKYYKNQMLKGAILVVGIILMSYLLVSLLEYFGHFNILVRTILFYLFIVSNIVVIGFFIIIPFLKLNKIGQGITEKQAAEIIGIHFLNIKDKLLNTLQLREMLVKEDFKPSVEFIKAGIDQKISELKPVPFTGAVNFGENKKYLRYTLVPVGIVLLLFVFSPDILSKSTKRLVQHQKYFEMEMPFRFVLLNDSLKAVKNEDYEIKLRMDGETLPQLVLINYDGKEFQMNRTGSNSFSHTIKNIRNDLSFNFVVSKYKSRNYDVQVVPKPMLIKFQVRIEYPAYINKEPEVLNNVGDLTLPEGSMVKWKFYVSEAEHLYLRFNEGSVDVERTGRDLFEYKRMFRKENSYMLNPANNYMKDVDSLKYFINIIPDAFPRIVVQQQSDSVSGKILFFNGEISDDYGLTRLTFNYKFTETNDSSRKNKVYSQQLPLNYAKSYQSFMHYWDMQNLNMSPGDVMEYYFQVWDNDGVNGNKSSISDKYIFRAPDMKEIDQKTDQLSSDIKKELEMAGRRAKELQRDLEKAKKEMQEKKEMNWENSKQIQDIMKQQDELKKSIEEIKEKYMESIINQDDFKDIDQEMLQKYKQLYDLFDQLMPEEIKQMFNELDELMKQNKKEDLQQNLDELSKDNKSLEKELDRMLELFKKMQFDQKVDDLTNKLQQLSKEQEELSKQTEDKKNPLTNIENKQNELNEKFQDIKKDFNELEKLNNELEKPQPLEDTKQDQEQIEQDQKQSLEDMKQNNRKESGKKQKNASKKMQEMAEKMSAMKDKAAMEKMEIDYDKLRQILDNLIYVSFEQEKLINELKKINTYNPQYVELSKKQGVLRQNTKIIEDSLYSLSRELPMISSVINKEINDINYNLDQLVNKLSDRQVGDARAKQQQVMTSINNLSLLLSEILDQMQSQMPSSGEGGMKMKKKGKGKKPSSSLGSIKDLQEQLNQQIQQAKKDMQSGKNPGGKEYAKMAAQQEMLRNQLRRMEQEKNKAGEKPGGDLNSIQKLMEKTEKDLVNKNINPQTLERQKEITVKLLEAEKAEKQQGEKEERKSKTAKEMFNYRPPSLDEYLKKREKENELLQAVPPTLNDFYRIKVKEYFRQLP